jgi:KDO2-lipid IV(A) lauroyltransferase
MRNTMREILEHQKAKKLFVIYLIGDQRPPKREIKYWQTFMNQDTCMITGPEKLARKYNMATVFIDMQRTKRGYYEIEFKLIAENSAETKEHEITAKYVKLVEQQIERKPEFYLWSHKRWKHKRAGFEGVR